MQHERLIGPDVCFIHRKTIIDTLVSPGYSLPVVIVRKAQFLNSGTTVILLDADDSILELIVFSVRAASDARVRWLKRRKKVITVAKAAPSPVDTEIGIGRIAIQHESMTRFRIETGIDDRTTGIQLIFHHSIPFVRRIRGACNPTCRPSIGKIGRQRPGNIQSKSRCPATAYRAEIRLYSNRTIAHQRGHGLVLRLAGICVVQGHKIPFIRMT